MLDELKKWVWDLSQLRCIELPSEIEELTSSFAVISAPVEILI
jgi:hypothetical protein